MEKRICIEELAPFASAEDLKDEGKNPLEADSYKMIKLTEIREEMTTPAKTTLLPVKSTTPRIDISRASSSSYQEDSSPESDFFFEKGRDSKLEVIFGEEMASELHSSTEELSFYDDTALYGDRKWKKKTSSQTASFSDIGAQNECRLRKDSGCSNDISLLCIGSGRTSRVSSVGSVTSGGSGISSFSVAASHLSADSNLSRGSSPHRTSVETSFCGPKSALTQGINLENDPITVITLNKICQKLETVSANKLSEEKNIDKVTKEDEVTLSRQLKGLNAGANNRQKKPTIVNPKTQKFVSLYSDEEDESVASRLCTASVANVNSIKPSLSTVNLESTQIFIPLKGDPKEELYNRRPAARSNSDSPKQMEPFTNTTLVNFISKYNVDLGQIVMDGVTKVVDHTQTKINQEFQTFISLKDDDDGEPTSSKVKSNVSVIEKNDADCTTSTITATKAILSAQYDPSYKTKAYDISKLLDRHSSLCQTTTATTTMITSNSIRKPLRHRRLTEKRDQDELYPIRANSNERRNDTDCLSVNKYETKLQSDDCINLQLDFSERPTRLTKSMMHLVGSNCNNKVEYHFSANMPPLLDGCDRGGNSKYLGVDNCRFRRSSESEKEVTKNDRPKSRSRSGSIQSLLSNFFKKSNRTNNKKNPSRLSTGYEDCRVEYNKWASGVNERVTQSSNEAADFIIIPLYSPDKAPSQNLPPPKQPHNIDNSSKAESPTIEIVDNLPTKMIPNVCQTIHLGEVPEEIPKNVESSFQKDNETMVHRNIYQNNDLPMKDQKRELEEQAVSLKINDQNVDKRIEYHPQNADETDESSDSDRGIPTVENGENRKLVNQEESFEELPYVPTTLPLERSLAVPIIPVKERINGIQTQSIDRPRLSTPSHRDSFDFCMMTSITATRKNTDLDVPVSANEKLYITLPRTSSLKNSKLKRYAKEKATYINSSLAKEVDKQIIASVRGENKPKDELSSACVSKVDDALPPLLLKKSPTWIGFDDTKYEYRQSPKRITTLPSSYATEAAIAAIIDRTKICSQNFVFVQPNECSCECHESLTYNTNT